MSNRNFVIKNVSQGAILIEIDGQSNAAGIAPIATLSADLLVPTLGTYVYPMQNADDPSIGWVQTIPGVNINGNTGFVDYFGIQPKLLRLLRNYYKRQIYLFCTGHGGSGLQAGVGNGNWSQSGLIYPATLELYNEGKARIEIPHQQLIYVWIQGEEDCNVGGTALSNYKANLTELINKTREDRNLPTMKFIIVSLSNSQEGLNSTNRTALKLSQKAVAQFTYNGGVISEQAGADVISGVWYIEQNNGTYDNIHYYADALHNIATDVFNVIIQ